MIPVYRSVLDLLELHQKGFRIEEGHPNGDHWIDEVYLYTPGGTQISIPDLYRAWADEDEESEEVKEGRMTELLECFMKFYP